MEFVLTSHGKIPNGRRPVEGGYEENGSKLYHAVAPVKGVQVPGKAAEHLYVTLLFYIILPIIYDAFIFMLTSGGCHVAFGGAEIEVSENYQVL